MILFHKPDYSSSIRKCQLTRPRKKSITEIDSRKFKTQSLYTQTVDFKNYSAPLAKPESFSDIINELEVENNQFNNSNTEIGLNKSLKTKKYINNLNGELNCDEDEESNLIWWPYVESINSKAENNDNFSWSKKKWKKDKYSDYYNLNNKIATNINQNDSDDVNQSISTSTPRYDLKHLKAFTQIESANSPKSINKRNIINNKQILYRISLNENYTSQPFQSILCGNNKRRKKNFIQNQSSNVSSSTNLRKLIHNFNISNNDSESSSSQSSNTHSDYSNPIDSTTNYSNLDSSIEHSLSFGHHNNLNDSNIKQSFAKNCNTRSDPNLSSMNLDNKNLLNDNNDESNYASFEKLALLKPQSKDYILCFDTSSIDQSSSIASNEDINNINLRNGNDLNSNYSQ